MSWRAKARTRPRAQEAPSGDGLAVDEEVPLDEDERDLGRAGVRAPCVQGGHQAIQRLGDLGVVLGVGRAQVEEGAQVGDQAKREIGAAGAGWMAHAPPPGPGPIAALSRRISASRERRPLSIQASYAPSG